MKFTRQAIAFICFVLVCGALLPAGEALAFGQQWRPTPAWFGAAQGRPPGQFANMPYFRPGSAVPPANYPRLAGMGQQPYLQGIQRRLYPGQMASAQVYRASVAGGSRTAGIFRPQPQLSPGRYAYPGRTLQPAAPAWAGQRQAPMFTQQYAWRPARQPWVAQVRPEWPHRPRYQGDARMAPQVAAFRPAGMGSPVGAGGWRPTVRPVPALHQHYAHQRYSYRAPGYTGNLQPRFRSTRPPVWQMPDARVAWLNPPPGVRAYWQPGSVAPTTVWQPRGSFRPVAYGRSLAGRAGPGSSNSERSGFTQENLPGWVTTYQETSSAGSCSWCSGS